MRRNGKRKGVYGIQRKLWLSMMSLILAVLVLVTIGVSLIAGQSVRENLKEQYSYVNDKFYGAFQGLYDQLDAVTENCITNANVQNSLKNKDLSLYDQEVISKTLQFVSGRIIDSYVYVDNKGNFYSRSKPKIDRQDLEGSRLYQGLADTYSEVQLFWGRDIFFDGEKVVLYAGRYVRQFDRDYAPGAIYVRLQASALQNLADETGSEKPAYFLLDQQGKICYRKYPEAFSQSKSVRKAVEKEMKEAARKYGRESGVEKAGNMAENKGSRFVAAESGFVFINQQEQTGFSIVTYVPGRMVHEVTRDIIRVIVLLFLLVLLASFFISHYVAKQFTRPIRYISEFMEKIDDSRLASPMVLHTDTELDEIGNSYNKMLKRIAGLIEQVTYKERELRKSEMDTLLYQIHPHFLYNTLDTVYMLARISKEETIMKMIQALSKYLRVILSNGAEEITVDEELKQVQAYLDIQNIRKSDLFSYEIHAGEEVRELSVIKMILQPIVENCIKHAFTDETKNAKIWIFAEEVEEEVMFRVENNGSLMPERECGRMNRLEKAAIEVVDAAVAETEGGYGVWNVVKRLRLRYQDKIRFLYSVSGERTICTIKIKKEMMKENENKKTPLP